MSGPVNGQRFRLLISDDRMRKQISRQHFVGLFSKQQLKTRRLPDWTTCDPSEAIRSRAQCGLREQFPYGVSLAHTLRRRLYMTDCRLGVHALGAGGVGSNPTGVTLFPRRYSLRAEHRRFSDSQLRRSLLKHIPTAVLEYMLWEPGVWVRIPLASLCDHDAIA